MTDKPKLMSPEELRRYDRMDQTAEYYGGEIWDAVEEYLPDDPYRRDSVMECITESIMLAIKMWDRGEWPPDLQRREKGEQKMNIFEMSVQKRVELLWGDNPDFKEITRIFRDHKRWSVVFDVIYQHIPSGKYYRMTDLVPATEIQEDAPDNRIASELVEVVPKSITTTVYEVV